MASIEMQFRVTLAAAFKRPTRVPKFTFHGKFRYMVGGLGGSSHSGGTLRQKGKKEKEKKEKKEKKDHGKSWNIMEYQRTSYNTIEHHKTSKNIIEHHRTS